MKKLLLFFLLLLAGLGSRGQVAIQVIVDGKPGVLISEFFGASSDRLQMNAITSTTRQVYFRASVTRTDNAVIIDNLGFKPSQPIVLNPGLNNFNGSNNSVLYKEMKSSDLNVTGVDKDNLFQSQTLPEGIYQICVYCYDYATDAQIGQGCQILNIQILEQPRIVTPMNAQIIRRAAPQAPTSVQIGWTPVPNAPGVRYDLKLIEVPNGVNPEEAVLAFGQGALPVKLQKNDLTMPAFMIDPSSGVTLDTGKTYALQVRAHGTNLNIRNDGLSDPVYFVYKGPNNFAPYTPPPPPLPADSNAPTVMSGTMAANCTVCKTALPSNTTPVEPSTLKVGSTFTMAGLSVTIVSVNADAAKKTISGTGTIPFPVAPGGKMPPVQIRFQDVKVNSGNIAFAGQAMEDALPEASFLPDADGQGHRIPTDPTKWKEFASWLVKNEAKQLLKTGSVTSNITYRLPIGISKAFSGKQQIVGITGLRMDPTQAVFDAVAGIDVLDASAGGAFILKAVDVCFNKRDMCGASTLLLGQDMSFSMGKGKGIIRLKAPPVSGNAVDTSKGTYALWNKNDGLKSFQVHGQYLFDKSLIISADKGDTVRSDLSFKSEAGWDDWKATVSIPKFQLASDTSFRFGPADATYDHSSLSNPSGVPANVIAQEGADWTGFYMKTLNIEFPAFVKSVNNPGRVQASVNDLAIDKLGVSGKLAATNILTLDNGTLDGWYFSIDNINLSIFHNSFDSGNMLGRLMLPVTDYIANSQDKRKWLDYSCTLTNQPTSSTGKELKFQFVVQPNNDLDFKIWKATASIEKSSKINVVYSASQSLLAEAKLNGKLTIEGKVAPLPKVKLDLIEVQELTLRTRSPYFNPGKTSFFGLASPEKQLGPFVFTLDEVNKAGGPPAADLKTLQSQSLEEEIGIRFAGSIKLTSISAAPKAATAMTIKTKIRFDKGRFSIDPSPKFQLDKIQLSGSDIAGISLTGGLELFADHATYGDGFKGNLAVTFPPGFAVGSVVQFGNVKSMDYWYVDASLKFPIGTGIPLFPGTKLAGFSGGAYYHMSPAVDLTKKSDFLSSAPAKANTKPDTASTPAIGSIPSGASYVPDGQTALGIKARLYFGLQADRILTCNTGLEIAFTPSWGISLFQVSGDGHYIPDSKDNGLLNAAVSAKVQWIRNGTQVVNTIFDASANVTAGNPLLSVNVPLKMHFERPSDPLWNVMLGRPRNPADAQLPKGSPRPDAAYIELLGGLAKAEGYFAVGNYDMPTSMPPVPKYITDILSKSKGGGDNSADDAAAQGEIGAMKTDFASKVESASGNKPSILLGASQEFHLDKTIAIIHVAANGGYGFDAMLRNYADKCPSVGFNGWYASAQAYAGLDVSLGVRVKFLGASFEKDFLEAGIAAILSGGLPNTTFLNGEAGGYYSVLDGAISGSFNVSFKLGDKPNCDMSTSALANVELINSITPDDGATDVPLETKPKVKFTFKGLAPFTLSDIGSDGTVKKKRQFVFARMVDPNQFNFNFGSPSGSDKNEGVRIDLFWKAPGGTESLAGATPVYTNEYSPPPMSNTMLLYPYNLPKPLSQARVKVIARLYENENYNNGQVGSPVKWALARDNGQIFEQTKEAIYTYTSGMKTEGKVPTQSGNKDLVQNAWPQKGTRYAHLSEKDLYGKISSPSISLAIGKLEPCYWSIPSDKCTSAVLKARLINLSKPADPVKVLNATTKSDYWGGLSIYTEAINTLASSGNIYALQYCWSWPDAAAKPAAQNGNSDVENALKTPSNFLPIYTDIFGVSKYGTEDAKMAALKTAGADFGKWGHLTAEQMLSGILLRKAVKSMTDEELLTPAELAAAKKEAKQGGGGLFYGNGVSPSMVAAMDTLNYWRILPHHLDLTSDEPFEAGTTLQQTNAEEMAAAQKLQADILKLLQLSAADTAQMKVRPLSHYAMEEEMLNEVPSLTDAELKSGKLSYYASPQDECSKYLSRPVYLQRSYNRLQAGDPTEPPKPGGGGIAIDVTNKVMGMVKAKKDLGRPAEFAVFGDIYDAVENAANQAGVTNAHGVYGVANAKDLNTMATQLQVQNFGMGIPGNGVTVPGGADLKGKGGNMKGMGK